MKIFKDYIYLEIIKVLKKLNQVYIYDYVFPNDLKKNVQDRSHILTSLVPGQPPDKNGTDYQ